MRIPLLVCAVILAVPARAGQLPPAAPTPPGAAQAPAQPPQPGAAVQTPPTPVPPVPTPPVAPPLPAAALVLNEPTAAAWLAGAGIPVRTVREPELAAALETATLVALPLQDVRQPLTVEALKAYVARGGHVLAWNWAPPGTRSPVASGLGGLLGVSVAGWSGRNNASIVATPAGKLLFNGSGRLRLGRGYAFVASPSLPSVQRPLPARPNGDKPNNGRAATNTVPVAPPAPAVGPDAPAMAAGRWVTDDGKPSRPAPTDAAVIVTGNTAWIGENLFDTVNRTAEVRRWFLNAAVTMAPALRLPAKQAVLTGAQSRLDAARAAIAAARNGSTDAGLADAQARLDAAGRTLTAAAPEMDFTAVLKAAEAADGAIREASALSMPARPVEVRAVWIEQASIPRTQSDIRRLVTRLADARFNVLLPEIVYRGRAAFPSAVYPVDSRFAGVDPLRMLIDEAHRRGLEVHPWVWTLCAGDGGEQGPLMRKHPEWAGEDRAGRVLSDGDGLVWLSPAIPAARTAIRNVIREIAAKYDVDGIHLDYIRYHSNQWGYSDASRSAYKAETGTDPTDLPSLSPKYVPWHLWRERQVNSLVKEIHDDLAAVKPGAKLSATVYRTPDDARREQLQDWALWVRAGWLDWVAPAAFTGDSAELSRWLADDAKASTGMAYLVPGLSDDAASGAGGLLGQIAAARAAGAAGTALSNARLLSDDDLSLLRLGPFRTPAATPWKATLAAARSLAAASSERLKALPVSDAAAAAQARAAAAEMDAWAGSADLTALASVPPGIGTLAPAGPVLDEARSLAAAAQQIAAIAAYRPGDAQQTPPPIVTVASPLPLPSLKVPFVSGAMSIDGKLDEPAWGNAATLALDRTWQGDKAGAPTTVKVMRDTSALYVGFTCAEPDMARLKAGVTERDGPVYNDDSVELFLSAGEKGMPYYHFAVGAAGGVADDQTGDPAWMAPWQSAVSRDVASWSVEIVVPFASLDASPTGEWHANLMRNRFAAGPEFTTWSVPYGAYRTTDRFGVWTF